MLRERFSRDSVKRRVEEYGVEAGIQKNEGDTCASTIGIRAVTVEFGESHQNGEHESKDETS